MEITAKLVANIHAETLKITEQLKSTQMDRVVSITGDELNDYQMSRWIKVQHRLLLKREVLREKMDNYVKAGYADIPF